MGEKIHKARTTTFSSVYATNVLLSETDSDVRLYAFNEIVDSGEGKIAISEGSIIMTDQATILLLEQLKDLVKKWDSEGKTVIVSDNRRLVLESMKDKNVA
jgi:hypothetical protein